MSFKEFSHVKLISFVSSSHKNQNIHHEEKRKQLFSNELSGKEASDFYKDVISSPSLQDSQCVLPKKKISKTKTLLPDAQTKNLKPNSILLFAQLGNLEKVKECLVSGQSINLLDDFGWTPIMCAACEGQANVVEYLLECGANVNLTSKEGLNVVDIARKQKHEDIVKLLEKGFEASVLTESNTNSCSSEVSEKYCSECKVHFKTSANEHERSIVHLLSQDKPNTSTFYHIPENNKGFQLMLKSGWNKNNGLGPNAEGRKFPIKTVLKKDRSCIGKKKEIAKVTHFAANDISSVISTNKTPVSIVRERTLKKRERLKQERIGRQREINFRRQFHDF